MHGWNLRYVLTVAEEKSISKAARKLYASQPAVSLHIKKLEDELGIKLFDRERLPLQLTYAGERFVAIATQIQNLERQLLCEMADINKCAKARLVIGISPLRGRSVLPLVLPVFKQRFPGVEVVLVEEKTRALEELTLDGKTDLWITNRPLKRELTITKFPSRANQLESTTFCRDEILAVVPDRYLPTGLDRKLYRNPINDGPEISLALLKNSPFILLKPGMNLRQIFDGMFSDAGFHKPNIILESESSDTLFDLALDGLACSLIYRSFIPTAYRERSLPVSFFRLDDPRAKSTLAAVYLKDRYMSNAAREFIGVCKEVLLNV